MIRDVELTPLALRRLDAIRAWTQDRFGSFQADRYLDTLEARFAAIRKGTAHLRSLDRITHNPAHAPYSAARAGEHFLILELTPARCRVLDVVHTRADLAEILNRSLPKDP